MLGTCLWYTGFAVGHWYFAHTYFKMPQIMPFLRGIDKIPEKITAANLRRDYVMVSLNLLAAIGLFIARNGFLYQEHGRFTTGQWNFERYTMWTEMYSYCKLAIYLLIAYSGFILARGIYRFWRLTKTDMTGMTDEQIKLP